MRVKVLGKYWRMVFGGVAPGEDGRCYSPEMADRQIRLRRSLRGAELLETVIHETLHAAGFHIDEAFVAEYSADVTKVLMSKTIWSRIVEHDSKRPRGRK